MINVNVSKQLKLNYYYSYCITYFVLNMSSFIYLFFIWNFELFAPNSIYILSLYFDLGMAPLYTLMVNKYISINLNRMHGCFASDSNTLWTRKVSAHKKGIFLFVSEIHFVFSTVILIKIFCWIEMIKKI